MWVLESLGFVAWVPTFQNETIALRWWISIGSLVEIAIGISVGIGRWSPRDFKDERTRKGDQQKEAKGQLKESKAKLKEQGCQ